MGNADNADSTAQSVAVVPPRPLAVGEDTGTVGTCRDIPANLPETESAGARPVRPLTEADWVLPSWRAAGALSGLRAVTGRLGERRQAP
jgi:hypothetical protein